VLAGTDPVATFHASRRYLELIGNHFNPGIAIPLVFLVYLTVLPGAFYRQHGLASRT